MNRLQSLAVKHAARLSSFGIICTLVAMLGVAESAAANDLTVGNNGVVWRNANTGDASLWLLNGSTVSGTGSLGTVSTSWVIVGVGDFAKTGASDPVWFNTSTGQVSIWLMSGTSVTGTVSPGTVNPSTWSIQGIGDFNGDGVSDILWQNTNTGELDLWLMTTTGTISQSINIGTVSDPTWTIQGIGDFSGAGHTDILWRNNESGQVAIWFMNGGTITSTASVGSVGPAWSIQGVGDFTGNGTEDIVWQNSTTGEVDIWLMSTSGSISSSTNAGTVPTPWTVVGVGRYASGSKVSGILWQDESTGQVDLWTMSGASISSSAAVTTVAPPWQVNLVSPYGCTNTVNCNILVGTNAVRQNGPFGSGNPAPSSTAGGPLFPYQWSAAATAVAQNWAQQCNGLTHNPNRGPFGENIYIAGSTSLPVAVNGNTDAVADWASESSNYTYSTNSCASGQECGHYTQLVWRATTAVGCAVAQCSQNSPFGASFPDYALVVCDYSPPGNFNNEQPY